MTRTVYINGNYLPENEAKISIFDRGFLMADSVYEVSAVIDGKLADNAAHLRASNAACTNSPCRCRCRSWKSLPYKKPHRGDNLQEGTVTCTLPAAKPTATSSTTRTCARTW